MERKTRIKRKKEERKNKEQRITTGLAILSIVVDVVALIVACILGF